MINFFLDENRSAGYTEYQPPHFVNAASGYGTGQLPDKEGQMYEMPVDGLYAIPTAEVPITIFSAMRSSMLMTFLSRARRTRLVLEEKRVLMEKMYAG